MQGLEAYKYRSTIHCIQELMRNEGIMAFYKGVGPRLTRVCLEVGITMSLYGEIVKAVSALVSLLSFVIGSLTNTERIYPEQTPKLDRVSQDKPSFTKPKCLLLMSAFLSGLEDRPIKQHTFDSIWIMARHSMFHQPITSRAQLVAPFHFSARQICNFDQRIRPPSEASSTSACFHLEFLV